VWLPDSAKDWHVLDKPEAVPMNSFPNFGRNLMTEGSNQLTNIESDEELESAAVLGAAAIHGLIAETIFVMS
jgi:hypothetical protein